jgi:hypothetical protein
LKPARGARGAAVVSATGIRAESVEAVAVASGGRIRSLMTTREKFETLLDRLSEDQLKAEYERLQRAVASGRHVDEWGDLDTFSARASLGVLRHMTEEEEKAGFSWEKYR